MDDQQILDLLQERVDAAGSQLAWCRANGFNGPEISQVLNGKRKITTRLANRLGYRRVIRYEPHADRN